MKASDLFWLSALLVALVLGYLVARWVLKSDVTKGWG